MCDICRTIGKMSRGQRSFRLSHLARDVLLDAFFVEDDVRLEAEALKLTVRRHVGALRSVAPDCIQVSRQHAHALPRLPRRLCTRRPHLQNLLRCDRQTFPGLVKPCKQLC